MENILQSALKKGKTYVSWNTSYSIIIKSTLCAYKVTTYFSNEYGKLCLAIFLQVGKPEQYICDIHRIIPKFIAFTIIMAHVLKQQATTKSILTCLTFFYVYNRTSG